MTSQTIAERFPNKRKMPYDYKILHLIQGDPFYICNLERLLLKKAAHYHYRPTHHFGGAYSECFRVDERLLKGLSTYIKSLQEQQIAPATKTIECAKLIEKEPIQSSVKVESSINSQYCCANKKPAFLYVAICYKNFSDSETFIIIGKSTLTVKHMLRKTILPLQV